MTNGNNHILRHLVEAANLIIETDTSIGKISFKDVFGRTQEVGFARKIKSSLPNAHWYFITETIPSRGGKPSDRSRVYLITDAVKLAEVCRIKRVKKGGWGAWIRKGESENERFSTFLQAKVVAEEFARKTLEKLKAEKDNKT